MHGPNRFLTPDDPRFAVSQRSPSGWRGEAWCARRWQLHVRPDECARLEASTGSLELVLELDLGRRTEAG